MELKQNISKTERLITILSSSYLLYKSLSGKQKNPALAASSALLLLRGAAGYCPVYNKFEIDHTDQPTDVTVDSVITVNYPREEVYAFWRKLENLPRIMKHLERVKVIDEKHSECGYSVTQLTQLQETLTNEKKTKKQKHKAYENLMKNMVSLVGNNVLDN